MNVQRPAVSVVIPHYNQNDYLERSLASVACQLGEEDEILIPGPGGRGRVDGVARESGDLFAVLVDDALVDPDRLGPLPPLGVPRGVAQERFGRLAGVRVEL